MSDGYAYAIRDESTGATKIGKSNDPSSRLSQLQTGSAGQLRLIGILAGGSQTEGALHAAFAHRRISGEWFRLNARDIEWLKSHPLWLGEDGKGEPPGQPGGVGPSCVGLPSPAPNDPASEKVTVLLARADAATIERARAAIRENSNWRVGATQLLRPVISEFLEAMRDGRLDTDACENEEEVRACVRSLMTIGPT